MVFLNFFDRCKYYCKIVKKDYVKIDIVSKGIVNKIAANVQIQDTLNTSMKPKQIFFNQKRKLENLYLAEKLRNISVSV